MVAVRKTTFLPFKQAKCCFKVLNLYLKMPKVSNKTQILRPFEGFSQVFKLCFWYMEVVYEKNGVLLLFDVIFFTFNSKFGFYCWIYFGLLH
jgi:hypothetical protein